MSAGFSYSHIMDMTLAQINLFVGAATRQLKSRMRNDVISALAGARYDEKALDKLLKDLK